MRPCFVGAVLVLLGLPATRVGSAGDKPAKPATAPVLELQLARGSLENVDDKAGRWQFAGGKVFQKGKQVGNYASVKRVVNQGTDEQNTAMLTITIFFIGKNPPENITLQGAHDFGSGAQVGSISAASPQYSAYIGKSFACKGGDIVTIK